MMQKIFLILFMVILHTNVFAKEGSVLLVGPNLMMENLLIKAGFQVQVFDPYCKPGQNQLNNQEWEGPIIAHWTPEHQQISFKLYRYLKGSHYDVIIYPSTNAVGFYITEAKKQGYAFLDTKLVALVQDPLEWTWDVGNNEVYDINTYLKSEHERLSVEQADIAVLPSYYSKKILKTKGWKLPKITKVIYPHRQIITKSLSNIETMIPVGSEVIFMGNCNFKNGFDLFVKTIKKLNTRLLQNLQITILNTDNKELCRQELKEIQHVKVQYHSATDYISNLQDPKKVVVFSSRDQLFSSEQFNIVANNIKYVAMNNGFIAEITDLDRYISTKLNTSALADNLSDVLLNRYEYSRYSNMVLDNHAEVEDLQRILKVNNKVKYTKYSTPFVSVCITHFNRTGQLKEALKNFEKQTYKNFEIVVMDDGSTGNELKILKTEIEPYLRAKGWSIHYQKNGFISNARNNLVNLVKGPLILLFEDDDLPVPDMIERFVDIKMRTKADVVNTNLALASKNKFIPDELWLTPATYYTSSIGENHVGYSAICLTSKKFYKKIGGFLDIYGFVYSDFEFYIRAKAFGGNVVTSIEPTYIYNFVGQDHNVYEGHRTHNYQSRIVLSAYHDALPIEFRNIPFWMFSLQSEIEKLQQENKKLKSKIKK